MTSSTCTSTPSSACSTGSAHQRACGPGSALASMPWPSPTTARSTGRRVRPGDDRAGHQADRRGRTYVARRSMRDKEARPTASPSTWSCCRELAGYQNLCRLITDAHSMATTTSHDRPRAPGEVFEGPDRPLGLSQRRGAKALEVDDWDLARKTAGTYREIFGKDRFFLEMQDHGLPDQRALNPKLLRLAPKSARSGGHQRSALRPP